ncbi:TIGR03751 family conjugal transfer lipoprotein [Methyloterricola oryzae]|uniref:TIGR03751 family conjugal transfer lipoprotein n=1 Tax=Methyloterricola oryzae TaxID=1495050 RepID=UPI0005EBDC7E|nr:TIGR03751 family conjugal transfer lipoprotein [Methyloterricola oryzae]
MQGRHRRRAAAAAISIELVLTGCSPLGTKDTILPQGGPSMKEVYDAHFDRNHRRPERAREEIEGRGPGAADLSLAGWTREANSEISNVFPRLPNPDLVLYVFPHMSGSGYPVPGYATVFPMYDGVEYALPGEMGGR